MVKRVKDYTIQKHLGTRFEVNPFGTDNVKNGLDRVFFRRSVEGKHEIPNGINKSSVFGIHDMEEVVE